MGEKRACLCLGAVGGTSGTVMGDLGLLAGALTWVSARTSVVIQHCVPKRALMPLHAQAEAAQDLGQALLAWQCTALSVISRQ